MAFFWFIIVIILTVALMSRKKDGVRDYRQGYWDGYRALGEKVQQELDAPDIDAVALQEAVTVGLTGAVVASQEHTSLFDTEELDDFMRQDEVVDEFELREDDSASTDFILGGYDMPLRSPMAKEVVVLDSAARTLRNLNVVLYMASFLLVAAGALFVAAAMPDAVKLVGVWLIVVLFYVVGYGMHRFVPRLRPASVAFLGTGLALVPFAGFALHQYTSMSPELAWMLTSLIGLAAYLLAAVRLQNQLVSYLAVAFVLSLVASGSASVSLGLVWQFVLFIGVALIANSLALVNPRWVPAIFREPIERTGQLVTPLVLVASLLVGDTLRTSGYELVFGVSTLYYLVVWLQSRRLIDEVAIRILASLTLLILAWDVWPNSPATIGLVLLDVATLQLVYSLLSLHRPGYRQAELTWLSIAFCVQAVAFALWNGGAYASLYNAIGLTVMGLSSLMVAVRLRQVNVGLIGLLASVLLPITLVRDVLQPTWPWWVLAVWFMLGAFGALFAYVRLRHRSVAVRQFMSLAYMLYAIIAFAMTMQQGGLSFTAVMLAVLAVFVVAVSYAANQAVLQLMSVGLLFIVFSLLSQQIELATEWRTLFVCGGVALLAYGATWAHAATGQAVRQYSMLMSAQLAVLLTIIGVYSSSAPIVAQITTVILLAWMAGSILLRIKYREAESMLARIFQVSYMTYTVAAILTAATLPQPWLMGLLGIAAAVAVWASYVERRVVLQIISVTLLFAGLVLASVYFGIPYAWRSLFVGGVAALLTSTAGVVHTWRRQVDRQLAMIISAHVTLLVGISGALLGEVSVTRTTATLFLAWAVASLVLRLRSSRTPLLRRSFQVAYPVYAGLGLLLTTTLAGMWLIAGLLIVGVMAWLSSYVERQPFVIVIANCLLIALLGRLWEWLSLDVAWTIVAVMGLSAALFYVGYWLVRARHDQLRGRILLWSSWLSLVIVSVSWFGDTAISVVSALALVALAVTMAIEGYLSKRRWLIEASMYVATLGLQRVVFIATPDLAAIWYAHWWALVIALATLLYKRRTFTRLILGLSLVSLSSAIYALNNGGWYQLLFLVEHIGLLVFGALRSKSWALWWGLAGSSLAVVYFLGGFTFLSLGFLGLLLIGIVVWRLLRQRV